MEKYIPFITVAVVAFVLIMLLGYAIRRQNRKEVEDEYADEMIYLRTVKNFTPSNDSSNDDFIDFMCLYAEQNSVPKDAPHIIQSFFTEQFETLKYSYIFSSKKALVLNNIPATVEQAVKKYSTKK